MISAPCWQGNIGAECRIEYLIATTKLIDKSIRHITVLIDQAARILRS
jgi:hypothetical protein